MNSALNTAMQMNKKIDVSHGSFWKTNCINWTTMGLWVYVLIALPPWLTWKKHVLKMYAILWPQCIATESAKTHSRNAARAWTLEDYVQITHRGG